MGAGRENIGAQQIGVPKNGRNRGRATLSAPLKRHDLHDSAALRFSVLPPRRSRPPRIHARAAAAPPVGKQNAGFYRYKVGTHEVTVVTDGVNPSRFPDSFVVNKNRDEVNARPGRDVRREGPDGGPYYPIAVNTGTKLVVIDTGTGEANFERSKGAAGQFHSNLKAAGINRIRSTP